MNASTRTTRLHRVRQTICADWQTWSRVPVLLSGVPAVQPVPGESAGELVTTESRHERAAGVGSRFAKAIHAALADPADVDDLLTVATEFLAYCPANAESARNMAFAACDLHIWRTAEAWVILDSFAREFRNELPPT
jgi:hypothetical protein